MTIADGWRFDLRYLAICKGQIAMRIRTVIGALTLLLIAANSAVAATTYVYDTLGRLSAVCYDNGRKITYTYDPAGNRSAVVTANGVCS